MRKRQGFRRSFRFKKKKSIFKNRFFGLAILVFVLLGFLSYFLFFSKFFLIGQIIVSGNEKARQQDIVRVIEQGLIKNQRAFVGKNIFLLSFNKIRKEILEQFPYIAEANIIRVLPKTIKCQITERKKIATFCADLEDLKVGSYSEECFFIDREGIIFEALSNKDIYLPKIKKTLTEKDLSLGEKVLESEFISKISELFLDIRGMDIAAVEIQLESEQRVNVITSDGWEMYFDPSQDLEWQITKLQAVLDEYIPPEKRKELDYIELRFGNLAPFKYKD